MNFVLACLFGCLVAGQNNFVEKPPAKLDDFKVVVRLFGPEKAPRFEADLVFHAGRFFQFVTQNTNEVTIYDHTNERFVIIDLKNRVHSYVSLVSIAKADGEIAASTKRDIERFEKDTSRNGRILAKMTKDLLEGEFTSSTDPKTGVLTMKNSTVDITARGELEPNADRLHAIRQVLIATSRLALVRDPGGLHPSSQVAAFKAMIDDKGMRPVEISFYFRLTGTPSLYRWTYDFEPTITKREIDALALIDQLLEKTKLIPYSQFSLMQK